MNDREHEAAEREMDTYIKRIEKLEQRVDALMIIEKQNAELVAALDAILESYKKASPRLYDLIEGAEQALALVEGG